MNFIRIISLSIILFCSGLNAQIKEKSIESVDLKSTKKKLKKKENPAYEILQEVWGYTPERHVDTRVVDVLISRLRAKLEDDPSNPELILTARGTGYLFQRILEADEI